MTIAYVLLFKNAIKQGFRYTFTFNIFKSMDTAREREHNTLVGTVKWVASFVSFWVAIQFIGYCIIFDIYHIHRWLNGHSVFGA